MLRKQKSPLLPRNLAPGTVGKLLIVFWTKVNLLYLLYWTAWRCCLLDLIKQNYLLKTALRILILMALVSLCLPVFPSRTNLKLHEISITPNMVKEVIPSLDSSKASDPDYIPVVVIKNWTLIHTSWALQYVSERVLFSRLLEGLIGGPCI